MLCISFNYTNTNVQISMSQCMYVPQDKNYFVLSIIIFSFLYSSILFQMEIYNTVITKYTENTTYLNILPEVPEVRKRPEPEKKEPVPVPKKVEAPPARGIHKLLHVTYPSPKVCEKW